MNIVYQSYHAKFQGAQESEEFRRGRVVYMFFNKLFAAIQTYNPQEVLVTWEGEPKFRKELYPEYKATRKKPAKNEEEQRNKSLEQEYIHKEAREISLILEKLPIAQAVCPVLEGDDIMAAFAVAAANAGNNVVAITSDKDMLQTICPRKFENGSIKIVSINSKASGELLPPDGCTNMVRWKSVVGDPSDNIVGIKGIGAKTAAGLCAMSDEQFAEWRKNLPPEQQAVILRNETLVRLRAPAEMQTQVDFKLGQYDLTQAKQKMASNNIKSLLGDARGHKIHLKFLTLQQNKDSMILPTIAKEV